MWHAFMTSFMLSDRKVTLKVCFIVDFFGDADPFTGHLNGSHFILKAFHTNRH